MAEEESRSTLYEAEAATEELDVDESETTLDAFLVSREQLQVKHLLWKSGVASSLSGSTQFGVIAGVASGNISQAVELSQEDMNELSELSSNINAMNIRIGERQAVTEQMKEDTRQILSDLAKTVAEL